MERVQKTFSIFVLKIAGVFSSYIFAYLVSKYYGAEGWGIFSICIGVATFGYLFGKFGFDMALLKFSSTLHQTREELSILKTIYLKAFKWLLPLGVFLTIFMILSSSLLSNIFFKNDTNSNYFIIVAFAILPTVFTLIDSEGLRGLGMTNKYVFLQNISLFLIASLLLIIYVIFAGNDSSFISIFIIYVIASVIVFIISRIWWHNAVLSKHPIINSEKVLNIKQILSISYPMFWSNAMFVIINWTDTLMLGFYGTETDVGVYNAAFKISNLVTLPLFVITSIVAPKYANRFALGDTLGLKTIVSQSTSAIFLLTLPVFIVISAFPSFFLNIFGASFNSGAPILIILLFGQFFKSFCGSTDYLLQMTGNEKIFQKIILSAVFLNIILNTILIPNYGSYGAAIANASTIVYWNIVATYFIKIKLNINALFNLKTFNLKVIQRIISGKAE